MEDAAFPLKGQHKHRAAVHYGHNIIKRVTGSRNTIATPPEIKSWGLFSIEAIILWIGDLLCKESMWPMSIEWR